MLGKKSAFHLNKIRSEGSSLIEILIATLVVGLVVTAIATGMSYTVRNSAEARFREAATMLGQDLVESFYRERNRQGWYQFTSMFTDGSTYCFSSIPEPFQAEVLASIEGSCGASDTVSISGLSAPFTREAVLDVDGETVTVTVTVSWKIDTGVRDIELVQQFKNWN